MHEFGGQDNGVSRYVTTQRCADQRTTSYLPEAFLLLYLSVVLTGHRKKRVFNTKTNFKNEKVGKKAFGTFDSGVVPHRSTKKA